MATYLHLCCETCEVEGPEVRAGWQADRLTLDEKVWLRFIEEHEYHRLVLAWESNQERDPASRPGCARCGANASDIKWRDGIVCSECAPVDSPASEPLRVTQAELDAHVAEKDAAYNQEREP